jgi:hypothetical protein
MRNKKTPGVSRIDQPEKHNHGYYVRLNRGKHRISKFFTDRVHGGKAKALKAATAFYAKIDQKYLRISRKEFASIQRRKNSSGLLGISKVTKDVKGRVYEFWQATWSPEPGVVAKKAFSIKKYGSEKAKAKAIKARKQGWNQMSD